MEEKLCSRCGNPVIDPKKTSGHFHEPKPGIFVCENCFTEEEEYESFAVAHYLMTNHYPDTEECHCFDEEQLELFPEPELNDDLLK